MPEITPTPPVTSTDTTANDEALMQMVVLQQIFEQAFKKPPADEDSEVQSSPVDIAINKTISQMMAQSMSGYVAPPSPPSGTVGQ